MNVRNCEGKIATVCVVVGMALAPVVASAGDVFSGECVGRL